jgi:large subunit ribosomal protein L25
LWEICSQGDIEREESIKSSERIILGYLSIAPEGRRMEEIQLLANRRTVVGKQVNALRREGLIPAIVYGGGGESIPVELNAKEAIKILNETSTSTLITLKVGKDDHRVLLRDIQYDVIKRIPIHVDFLRVEMDTAIRTSVPIDFVGEAPGVKEQGGVLVIGLDELEIEALPADLPDKVVVDLEVLEEIDSMIIVSDVFVGKGVEVLTEPDEVLAHIVYQEIEEIEEEEVEAVVETGVEPELVEREKHEEFEEEEES